jgi:hypothetical protein
MPDSAGVTQLRDEMRDAFQVRDERVRELGNELHRHQDVYRTDMGFVRAEISSAKEAAANLAGQIQGSLGMLRWLIVILGGIAATSGVIGLVHHW